MKKLTFLLLFVSIVFKINAQSKAEFFDELINKNEIPGLTIAYFEDNTIVYHGHHGVKSNDTKDKITDNSIFGGASLSKPVFAYAVLKLVEQGYIDLDKPLYTYLENKDLKEDERYKQITTRMVLSHSSGLPNWRNGKLKLKYTPGTTFQYSGEGYMYLAKVVEHILQKPINEVMKTWVFEPLDMKNSSYLWETRFENDFASPHNYTDDPKPNWRPKRPVIASSLQTTSSDYTKLMLAILQRKEISRSLYKQIKKPQIKINDTLAWGLGWGIKQSKKGNYLWQWGDNGTFKAFTMMYPKKNKGMVFFVNSYRGLRLLPEIVSYLFDDTIPEFNMLKRSMRVTTDEKMIRSILKHGYDKGIKKFLQPNSTLINSAIISEGQASYVAMQLKWRKRFNEEKSLLKMITKTFSTSFNAHKNYAVHCVRNGFTQEGIEYYKKALAIKPDKEVANTVRLLTSKQLEGNVTFVLKDYLYASSVSVSGTFNNWSYSNTPLLKKNGVWITTIQLPPGEYAYQFIVDGYSMLDPKNQEVKKDSGQIGSLLQVKK